MKNPKNLKKQPKRQPKKQLKRQSKRRKQLKEENHLHCFPQTAVLEIFKESGDGRSYGSFLKDSLLFQEFGPLKFFLTDYAKGPLSQLKDGDHVLARLSQRDDVHQAFVMRVIKAAYDDHVMGIYFKRGDGGRVFLTNKVKNDELWVGEHPHAHDGALVICQKESGRRLGLPKGKVIKVIENFSFPHCLRYISLKAHDIPFEFPASALSQACKYDQQVVMQDDLEDLRHLPFVTIDGPDAKDFDDALWCEKDSSSHNPGGFRLYIAIADVAWYVPWGSDLDHEASKRGNSVYFPDGVVPMLPFELSNGLCSLVPDQDRRCLGVEVLINGRGEKLSYRFFRGLMRSRHRLTYEYAQDCYEQPSLNEEVFSLISPLYQAYLALDKARQGRGVLEINMPERSIELTADGKVSGVCMKSSLPTHRMIENMMVLANVCAAEELERLKQVCVYRLHAQPSDEKIQALKEFLHPLGYDFHSDCSLTAKDFNQVLNQAQDRDHVGVVHRRVLQSQSQAFYGVENQEGHFGLSLERYAHFTSPIRRYADLLVHRALIEGLFSSSLKSDGPSFQKIKDQAQWISSTERRAVKAERECCDRYMALYLENHVGQVFCASISGIQSFGIFVELDETQADCFLPFHGLGTDYYHFDEKSGCVKGYRSEKTFYIGQKLKVRLIEVNPFSGRLQVILEHMPWEKGNKTNLKRKKTSEKKDKRRSKFSNKKP